MFAHDAYKASCCSGCGQPLDETTAVGRDDDFDAELIVCHRCAAGDRTLNAHSNNKGDTAGLRVRTFERTPYEPQAVTET